MKDAQQCDCFKLSAEDERVFVDALVNPPEPNATLRKAALTPAVEPVVDISLEQFNDMVTTAMEVAVAANHMEAYSPRKSEVQERIVVGAIVRYVLNAAKKTTPHKGD